MLFSFHNSCFHESEILLGSVTGPGSALDLSQYLVSVGNLFGGGTSYERPIAAECAARYAGRSATFVTSSGLVTQSKVFQLLVKSW